MRSAPAPPCCCLHESAGKRQLRLFGQTAIWMALLMSAWSFVVYVVGSQRERADLIRSGDRAIHVVCASTLLATLVLAGGLLRHDFSMRYVATYSSLNLPAPYRVSALWSGQRGSLLLATCILSALTCLIVVTGRRNAPRLHVTLLALLLVVLSAMLCIALDPLGALAWVPVDGIGMFPALQTAAAVVYPPLLIAAYVTAAVAGTGALELILRRSAPPEAVARIARWSVAAWVLNTLGVVASLWWAYREPSRSSEWLSYSIESGALLPWVLLTAFLFSLNIGGRSSLPGWTLALPVGAMILSGPAAALTTASLAQDVTAAATSGLFIAGAVAAVVAIVAAAFAASRRVDAVAVPSRESRPYGSTVLAAGLLVTAAAAGGAFARTESVVSISVTEPAEVVDAFGARWSFAGQGLSRYSELNRQVDALGLDVQRNGEPVGLMTTEMRQYVDALGEPVFPPSRKAGVRSTMREDVYAVFRDLPGEEPATLSIVITPLQVWFWIGGLLVAIGGLLVCWPQRPGVVKT
jgi:cytochrome c biogenesis factor